MTGKKARHFFPSVSTFGQRRVALCEGLLYLLFAGVPAAYGQSEYYRHQLFDNSITPDSYFYSSGSVQAPSKVNLIRGKLPVDTHVFRTPPNSLRIEWRSQQGGSWEAEVKGAAFRNRLPGLSGKNLYFWCYSAEAIRAFDLPRIVLSTTPEGLQVAQFPGSFSRPLPLGQFSGDIPAGRWVQVRIPFSTVSSAGIYEFRPEQLQNVIFLQGSADNAPHTLVVDEFRVDDEAKASAGSSPSSLPAPQHLQAKGYDRHIMLSWDPVTSAELGRYVIYRSLDEAEFQPIGIQIPGTHRYSDFLGKAGVSARYKVVAQDNRYRDSSPSAVVWASTKELSDEELLTMLQEACFHYYWEGADPHSGMTRESIPGDDRIVATGASGFGIMALVVGVDRHFISREEGLTRVVQIVDFLEKADRFHGAWAHFMDGKTGKAMAVFGIFDDGGDLVETSFLMQGLLAARQYFNGDAPKEKDLFKRITALWETVEWDWYRESATNEAIYWHWSPVWNFQIRHRLTGFNEVMITYLLAIASPTHPVPPELYYTGWAGQSEAAERRSPGGR